MKKLILNTSLPTLNNYINANRKSRFAGAKMKKDTEEKIGFIALTSGFTLEKNTLFDVEIEWYFKDKRTDPDNRYFAVKFILDALQKVGILDGDGHKNIRNITHKNCGVEHEYCIVYFRPAS